MSAYRGSAGPPTMAKAEFLQAASSTASTMDMQHDTWSSLHEFEGIDLRQDSFASLPVYEALPSEDKPRAYLFELQQELLLPATRKHRARMMHAAIALESALTQAEVCADIFAQSAFALDGSSDSRALQRFLRAASGLRELAQARIGLVAAHASAEAGSDAHSPAPDRVPDSTSPDSLSGGSADVDIRQPPDEQAYGHPFMPFRTRGESVQIRKPPAEEVHERDRPYSCRVPGGVGQLPAREGALEQAEQSVIHARSITKLGVDALGVLQKYFGKYGDVDSVCEPSLGSVFIKMRRLEDAQKALRDGALHHIDGLLINIELVPAY
eukprot:TRINITY_DN75641_c0_g1_i1.p1 TRINITY_DN75641_c0_g1~~TRINITY_DN75641_c0_g1_i1.p1  ORF type:complete len:344 (-),score=55.45 TRINITY_DN75641_c0_g1_i1:221-1195(-)